MAELHLRCAKLAKSDLRIVVVRVGREFGMWFFNAKNQTAHGNRMPGAWESDRPRGEEARFRMDMTVNEIVHSRGGWRGGGGTAA
jgi:hypothetical protein